mgnify:CR=1 FL=1
MLGKNFQFELANRIIADNVCVIEGDESELLQAMDTISIWRMTDQKSGTRVNDDFIQRCASAESAIRRRLTELKAIDKATD